MKDHLLVQSNLTIKVSIQFHIIIIYIIKRLTKILENENVKNNFNRKQNFRNANNFQQNRVNNKGRFTKQQKWKSQNKTVHINPHFRGDVQINGNG